MTSCGVWVAWSRHTRHSACFSGRQAPSSALLETRRHFLTAYNNPLGLAYVLYAMQGARILPDFTPAGAEP